MSFGFRDASWVDPDDVPVYERMCCECDHFIECGCGCGWGYCNAISDTDIFDGRESGYGCEYAIPTDGFYKEPRE